MPRSAASLTLMPAPAAAGSPTKARLVLAELLLASGDLHVSARHCLDWLARHANVRQSLLAVVDQEGTHLLVVADHGIGRDTRRDAHPDMSSQQDLVIGCDESTHLLVLAMTTREPSYFARAATAYPPLADTGFHAFPLRAEDEGQAYGILLASSTTAAIDPDVAWLARQLVRLLARPGTAVPLFPRDIPGLAPGRAGMPERHRAKRLAELERHLQDTAAQLTEQTEQLRCQQHELEQASVRKSQFLTNISHELRTPLNAILGYTQMLLRGVTGAVTEPQRKSLSRIDSNSRHLEAVISDILDITRIEAGQMPLNVTSVRIPDLVDELLSELEPVIRLKGLAVTARMRRTMPAVRTDRQKLKQIVRNLLSNALKFTATGSVTIGATVETRRRMITIVVRDTGIGIPEESRSKIFEDLGLGLPICRRLAQMLGGSIDVESQVGEGSTFTLRLPVHARRR